MKDEQREKSRTDSDPDLDLPTIRPRQHCLPKILHSGKTFCLLYCNNNSNGFNW